MFFHLAAESLPCLDFALMDVQQDNDNQGGNQHQHNANFNGFCHLCGHEVGSDNVVSHQNVIHKDAKVKCESCGHRFNNKADLRTHQEPTQETIEAYVGKWEPSYVKPRVIGLHQLATIYYLVSMLLCRCLFCCVLTYFLLYFVYFQVVRNRDWLV